MFDMKRIVKRAYKYRFYPTPEQAQELARTFGCVRKVWNLALEARTTAWHQRHERVSYLQSSALLTGWKHSDNLGYLNEVSSVLVRDNQAVVIEDLSVRNMIRNHHLARAISDAAWRQMRAMLAYKCQWYGRDRW